MINKFVSHNTKFKLETSLSALYQKKKKQIKGKLQIVTYCLMFSATTNVMFFLKINITSKLKPFYSVTYQKHNKQNLSLNRKHAATHDFFWHEVMQ